MFNGDSGYGGCGGDMACTVTGVEKFMPATPVRWVFPIMVWHWS